jgi:hypothetical protein
VKHSTPAAPTLPALLPHGHASCCALAALPCYPIRSASAANKDYPRTSYNLLVIHTQERAQAPRPPRPLPYHPIDTWGAGRRPSGQGPRRGGSRAQQRERGGEEGESNAAKKTRHGIAALQGRHRVIGPHAATARRGRCCSGERSPAGSGATRRPGEKRRAPATKRGSPHTRRLRGFPVPSTSGETKGAGQRETARARLLRRRTG